MGYNQTNIQYQGSTPDLLYTILKEASATSGNVGQWDYRTGWGYVRLENAYNQGRSWGRYATCTPMDLYIGCRILTYEQ